MQQLERGIALTESCAHQGLKKNEHTIPRLLFPQSLNALKTCPCRDAWIVRRRLCPGYASTHPNYQKQANVLQFHELLHIICFSLIQRLAVALYSDG